jgi:putative ABC transport system substrate-binding protein
MNNRRKLIVALGAGVLGTPFGSFAQPPGKVWRVGVLVPISRPAFIGTDFFDAFPRGMRELGYVEGKNLVIEWRFADGNSERLPGLAAELVQLKVDVILAVATPATAAVHKATSTIPVVTVNAGDPIGSGFIKSLARPEGNITGLTNMAADMSVKHLEMLRDMVPKLSHVAFMLNPGNQANFNSLRIIQAVAPKANVKILKVEASTPQEIDNAFIAMAREKVGAVIVTAHSLFLQQRRQIAELAAKYRLPSASARREQVEAGFLMSYGPNDADMFRRAATYVDKIFKGARPGDLPVEQPTKFEMFINGKTAKALGLTIPQSLLIMADKVIE